MTVLCHDALGNIVLFRVLIIIVVPVQKENDVRVLLDGAGFPQVREHGALIVPLLVGTGQLAQTNNRDIEFFGHNFEHSGHIGDHLLAALAAAPAASGGGHQLQIVDDHQSQIVQTAALGVHIRHGEHGVVIDPDVHLVEDGGGTGDLLPVGLPEGTGLEAVVFHTGLGRQQPGGQLFPGHFQGEHRHGLVGALGHVQRDVQRKGGFAHAGPGRQQNQVRLVQTRDLLVHGGKAGGKARQVVFALAHLAQPVQHVRQHLPQGDHILGALAPADGIHLLLGGLQNIAGLAHALLDHGSDLRRRLGHPPQQRLVVDDGHVLHHVGAGGGDLHQLGQVRAGGVLVVGAVFPHLLAHRDAVDGAGIGEHGVDGLKNIPVLPEVEVRRPQLVHHVLDAALVDEHGAQHRLLPFQGVGHLPQQQVFIGHGSSPPVLRICRVCFVNGPAALLPGICPRRESAYGTQRLLFG